MQSANHDDTTLVIVPDRTHRSIVTQMGRSSDAVTAKTLSFIRELLPRKLLPEKIGQILPIYACGDVYLAGQPQPEDLSLLKKEGVKTIITLRQADEVPWDEAAAVKAHGIEYVYVPFQDPKQLTPETVR